MLERHEDVIVVVLAHVRFEVVNNDQAAGDGSELLAADPRAGRRSR